MNASFYCMHIIYPYFRFIEHLFYQNFRFTDYYFTTQQHSKKILTYIVNLNSDSINKLNITVKWVTQKFWVPSVQKVYLHCTVTVLYCTVQLSNWTTITAKYFFQEDTLFIHEKQFLTHSISIMKLQQFSHIFRLLV